MTQKYYKNHRIQKKWGQNFLKDQNIINSIINILNPTENQTIIEIGPGLGALTYPILKIINSLTLIELDPYLSIKLNQIFNNKKIKIFNQDVMTIDFLHLSNQSKYKLRLIGNLPYNISTKLILYLLRYINIIYDMHFMFQKEVAHRLVAQPNNKAYGRLSVLTQYYCKVSSVLEIPKKSFIPIPKIDSTMIKFIPYNVIPYPLVNIKLLSMITRIAFCQRRKTIKNSLSSFFTTTEMIKNNIDVNVRAENLTIQQFCVLTNILHNKNFNCCIV